MTPITTPTERLKSLESINSRTDEIANATGFELDQRHEVKYEDLPAIYRDPQAQSFPYLMITEADVEVKLTLDQLREQAMKSMFRDLLASQGGDLRLSLQLSSCKAVYQRTIIQALLEWSERWVGLEVWASLDNVESILAKVEDAPRLQHLILHIVCGRQTISQDSIDMCTLTLDCGNARALTHLAIKSPANIGNRINLQVKTLPFSLLYFDVCVDGIQATEMKNGIDYRPWGIASLWKRVSCGTFSQYPTLFLQLTRLVLICHKHIPGLTQGLPDQVLEFPSLEDLEVPCVNGLRNDGQRDSILIYIEAPCLKKLTIRGCVRFKEDIRCLIFFLGRSEHKKLDYLLLDSDDDLDRCWETGYELHDMLLLVPNLKELNLLIPNVLRDDFFSRFTLASGSEEKQMLPKLESMHVVIKEIPNERGPHSLFSSPPVQAKTLVEMVDSRQSLADFCLIHPQDYVGEAELAKEADGWWREPKEGRLKWAAWRRDRSRKSDAKPPAFDLAQGLQSSIRPYWSLAIGGA